VHNVLTRSRKPLRHTQLRTLAAASLAVAVLAGCGSSSSTPPAGTVAASAYVGQFCTSVVSWYRGLSVHSSTLNNELAAAPKPAATKKSLESFLSVSITDTEGVVSSLRGAGVPDVKNGSSVSKTLVSAFESAESALKALQPSVATISSSDSAASEQQAASVGKHVSEAVKAIPLSFAALGTVKSPELVSAIKTSSACKSVGAQEKS
jgi:hypothetical protein